MCTVLGQVAEAAALERQRHRGGRGEVDLASRGAVYYTIIHSNVV